MSNRRKLRKPKGDINTRLAIRVSRRAKQEFAIRRKALATKITAPVESVKPVEPVDSVDPNACFCGRTIPKVYRNKGGGYCCVACTRGEGHTPSCNKREAA